MTFKKGQKINRGAHLSAETKAKIIKDRKAGKKWKEIAADLNIPVKRAMTYAKRKWYKAGMKNELVVLPGENKPGNDDSKDEPGKKKDEGKNEPGNDDSKDEPGKDKSVVDKTKKKAAANIDKAVDKHIKKTDKAPNKGKQTGNVNNDKGVVDKDAKTGLSERKSINIWFLLAVIIVVATIGLIFIIMRPKGAEKADYNKPTKEEDKGGFEGRKISDI